MQLKKLCVVLSFSTVCFMPAVLAEGTIGVSDWLDDIIESATSPEPSSPSPSPDSGPKQPDPSNGTSGG